MNCVCLATRILSARAADTSDMAYHPAPAITIDRSMSRPASTMMRSRIERFINILRRPDVGRGNPANEVKQKLGATTSGFVVYPGSLAARWTMLQGPCQHAYPSHVSPEWPAQDQRML